jgi:hypothetical protein
MVKPAAEEPEAEVTAVAAGDLERAGSLRTTDFRGVRLVRATARRPRHRRDLYMALPNGLHGCWT